MEMPIRIMVVLFVSLVVGVMMIMFAKNIIDQGKNTRIIPEETPEEEKILKFQELTTGRVVELGKQCILENKGVAIDRVLCFVVTADESTIVVDDILNGLWVAYPNVEVLVSDKVMDNDYSLSIYFDPTGVNSTLEITR